MKKLILLAILALNIQMQTRAQVITDTSHRAADTALGHELLQKSKSQKTAAIVLVIAGGAAITGAAIGIGANLFGDTTPYEVLFYVGMGSALGSIPLFIASHKNKKKAQYLLRFENTPVSRIIPGTKTVTGLGIAISF